MGAITIATNGILSKRKKGDSKIEYIPVNLVIDLKIDEISTSININYIDITIGMDDMNIKLEVLSEIIINIEVN